jgi:tetratricopeptide (TPR) repeat protein
MPKPVMKETDTRGSFTQSINRAEEALRERIRRLGTSSPELVELLQNLASHYQSADRYREAQILYERAGAILEETSGPLTDVFAANCLMLAHLHNSLHHFAEAIPLLERAIEILEQLPSEHWRRRILLNERKTLAQAWNGSGDWQKAVDIRERILKDVELTSGQNDNQVTELFALAEFYVRHGQTEKAYRRVLDIAKSLHASGENSTERLIIKSSLGLARRLFGPRSIEVAFILNRIADGERGNWSNERISNYEKNLDILQSHLPFQQSLATEIAQTLLALYLAREMFEKADGLLTAGFVTIEGEAALLDGSEMHRDRRLAEAMRKKFADEQPAMLAEVYQSLAKRALVEHRLADAEAFYCAALALAEQTWGAQSLVAAEILDKLTELYVTQQRLDDAISTCERTLAIQTPPYLEPSIEKKLEQLRKLYEACGRRDEAEDISRRLQEMHSIPVLASIASRSNNTATRQESAALDRQPRPHSLSELAQHFEEAQRDAERPMQEAACSVFAPTAIRSRQVVFLQVYLHQTGEAASAAAVASQVDPQRGRQITQNLELPLRFGDEVEVLLESAGLHLRPGCSARQHVIWRGRSVSVVYQVTAPSRIVTRRLLPVICLSVGGQAIGRISFRVDVGFFVRTIGSTFHGEARLIRRAFLSYSSVDRGEVLKRAQALKLAGIEFFQDVLHIQPGRRWRRIILEEIGRVDVVYLFWSQNARKSRGVTRELKYAVRLQKRSPSRCPDIIPVILDIPPPPPPRFLRHLHFNDPILSAIALCSPSTRPP